MARLAGALTPLMPALSIMTAIIATINSQISVIFVTHTHTTHTTTRTQTKPHDSVKMEAITQKHAVTNTFTFWKMCGYVVFTDPKKGTDKTLIEHIRFNGVRRCTSTNSLCSPVWQICDGGESLMMAGVLVAGWAAV